MAETIVHQVEHKNVNFICKTGNIAEAIAELAILSSDPQYSMDVGAARAVANVGGRLFYQKRNEAIIQRRDRNKSYITIDTEDIEELPFRYVVVVPIRGKNRQCMRVVYRECIKAAIDSRMQSVVMPLLGIGGLNISINKASQEMLESLLTFSSFGNITTFSFIDINAQSMERLGALLSTIPEMLPTPDPGPSSYGIIPAPAYLPSSSSQQLAPVLIRPEVQFVGVAEHVEAVEREVDKLPYKEIDRSDLESQNHDNLDVLDNTQILFPCSICLGDLVKSAGNGEGDAASLRADPLVRMKLCTHVYHKSCIEGWFNNKKRCPLCMKWYATSMGNQPLDSKMTIKRVRGNPEGHPDADGWIKIRYVVNAGIQTEHHLRPGKPHSGTTRVAYLPNDEGGRNILSLLRKAFEHRHIFTIGDSLTTGAQNCPVWAIHHKTSMSGGPACYGYPDPEYYGRVVQELAEVGITREMID